MCRLLKWFFTGCDPNKCRSRGEATHRVQVEPCASFAHANPPFRPIYFQAEMPACWPRSPEPFKVEAECQYCYRRKIKARIAAGEEGLSEYGVDVAVLNDSVVVGGPIGEFIWYVRQGPWVNLHFREIDWNPPAREQPLDEADVTPTTTECSPVPPPSGVLNAEYDPQCWELVDKSRTITLFVVDDDLPVGNWPRPMKPSEDHAGPASELPIHLAPDSMSTVGWVWYEEIRGKILETYGARATPSSPSSSFYDSD